MTNILICKFEYPDKAIVPVFAGPCDLTDNGKAVFIEQVAKDTGNPDITPDATADGAWRYVHGDCEYYGKCLVIG